MPLIAEYDALRFIFDGYKLPLVRVLDEPALLTKHYREVSTRLGAEFRPSVSMMNQLASIAMSRDTTKGLELARMTTESYPDHPRAWELIGDVWAARRDPAQARSYYERALARSPGNEAIRRKLDMLGRSSRR